MELETAIFHEAFKDTPLKIEGMKLDDLFRLSVEHGKDPKKNFALRPLLVALDHADGTKHCPDHHIGLAQCYLEIGLIYEATRSAALATAQYLMEGGPATSYAEHGGRILVNMGRSPSEVQDIFENPRDAYHRAFYEITTNGKLPRVNIRSNQGGALKEADKRQIHRALDLENRLSAYQRVGIAFSPQKFSPEQMDWINIVLSEATLLLEKLGIHRVRNAQASDLVCVEHGDFRKIASSEIEGQRIDNDTIHDAITLMSTVFLEKDQSLSTFIHSLCHEVFGHLSATRTVEYDKQKGIAHRARLGLRIQNKTKTGFDIRFEVLDEIMTEILGYMLRLQLLFKYRKEITEQMGNEGMANLYKIFCTSRITHIGLTVLQAICAREKVSPIEAMKMMCEAYYKGKTDFYGKMRLALGDEKFKYVVGQEDNGNLMRMMEQICESNVLGDMLNKRPVFQNNDPLSEPLFRDMLAFLQS